MTANRGGSVEIALDFEIRAIAFLLKSVLARVTILLDVEMRNFVSLLCGFAAPFIIAT